MTRILPLVLSLGCSDYEVSRIEQAEEKSWFEETSESYQDDFDPSSSSEDTPEQDDDHPAQADQEDKDLWVYPKTATEKQSNQ